MIYRIKQVFNYLFPRLKEKDIDIIKLHLKTEEQNIYFEQSAYDKKHSYTVFRKIMKNTLLKDDILYRKLALLHDCGKGKETSFSERAKYVIFKKGRMLYHPKRGFEKIKDIDYKLALLILKHHNKNIDNEKLRAFQKIDNKN